MSRLAFCVFSKQLHVAWETGDLVVPLEESRLETILFDTLDPLIQKQKFKSVIIPAGPAPFTQLRILRATQLGLATGLRCTASMINMFDVLFTALSIKTGACLLETRRGDHFFQTRKDGQIMERGVTVFDSCTQHLESVSAGTQKNSAKDHTIISDDPKLATITITTQNLAKTMLENNFTLHTDLIYGITLPYSTKGIII